MPLTQRKEPVSEGTGSKLQQLMSAMGATKGWDPIPPDQYLTYQDKRYSPEIRLWAWLLSKTIRHGHRSPYAVDERGNELRIEHAVADLGMDSGNARRAWRNLEIEKRVSKQGRKLCIHGSFELPETATKKLLKVCTDLFELPFYRRQLNRLPPDRQADLKSRYEREEKLARDFLAEAVAGGRTIFDQRKDTVLSEFGIKKIRLKQNKNSRKVESALLPDLVPAVEKFVQTFTEQGSVPASNGSLYNREKESVQPAPSLLNRELPETTEKARAGADGPSHQNSKHQASGNWELSLNKARESFPHSSPGLIGKFVKLARPVRAGITDEELSRCLYRRPGQDSVGLWMLTVPEDAHRLNDGEPVGVSPDDIIEAAKRAEKQKAAIA